MEANDIKSALKQAMTDISAAHPLYGKWASPPMSYKDWWGQVIEQTFRYAHVAESGKRALSCDTSCVQVSNAVQRSSPHDPADLKLALPTLLPELIGHFATDKAYILHEDVLPCLQMLKGAHVKLGILTNSDPRAALVVESLGITPTYVPNQQ